MCLLRLLLFPFRPARTLRTHLVRAKVYPVEERLVRSRKCLRNRCRVCKMLWKQTPSKVYWTKSFTSLITDLHVVINAWSISSHVKFVDGNILVKLLTSLDIDATIIRIITGKV